MADLVNRYPLATADGKSIPLDVLRPFGTLKKTFLVAASTPSLTVPANCNLMGIYTTEDCIIQFAASGAVAAALVDGVVTNNAFFSLKNLTYPVFITPPVGMKSMALRGDTANGIAIIEYLETWSALSTSAQPTRR